MYQVNATAIRDRGHHRIVVILQRYTTAQIVGLDSVISPGELHILSRLSGYKPCTIPGWSSPRRAVTKVGGHISKCEELATTGASRSVEASHTYRKLRYECRKRDPGVRAEDREAVEVGIARTVLEAHAHGRLSDVARAGVELERDGRRVVDDAGDARVRGGRAGEVEERDEGLVGDLVQGELERVACVRDAREGGEDRGEDRADRDCAR